MKKAVCMLLSLLLCGILAGCQRQQKEQGEPVSHLEAQVIDGIEFSDVTFEEQIISDESFSMLHGTMTNTTDKEKTFRFSFFTYLDENTMSSSNNISVYAYRLKPKESMPFVEGERKALGAAIGRLFEIRKLEPVSLPYKPLTPNNDFRFDQLEQSHHSNSYSSAYATVKSPDAKPSTAPPPTSQPEASQLVPSLKPIVSIPTPSADGDSPRISRKNYNKITMGMTYEEVCALLGPGKLATTFQEENTHACLETYQWILPSSASRIEGITIWFKDGKCDRTYETGL